MAGWCETAGGDVCAAHVAYASPSLGGGGARVREGAAARPLQHSQGSSCSSDGVPGTRPPAAASTFECPRARGQPRVGGRARRPAAAGADAAAVHAAAHRSAWGGGAAAALGTDGPPTGQGAGGRLAWARRCGSAARAHTGMCGRAAGARGAARPAAATGVLGLVLLALLAGPAAAAPCPGTNGHLRFGSISYRQVSGYTVTFVIETQWRRSYSSENVFAGSGTDGRAVAGDIVDVPGVQISADGVAGPVVFQTGDGTKHPLFLTVTHHSYNMSEDFLHGYSTLQHTYRAPNDGGNDWLASLSGCCRQYGPEFRTFEITARVNLALDGESLRAKALPVLVVTSSPVPQLVHIAANTYTGGIGMAWRIGQGSELGTASMPPTSVVDFPVEDNGLLQINGSALGVGCHPVVVQIASVRSVTPYDVIIKVIPHYMEPLRPVFILGKPLVTNYTAPGIRSPKMPRLWGYAGYMIYFTISARTTRPGATLADIRSFALPEGAELVNVTTEGTAGNHVMHVDFKWIPLPEQSNTHYVCFEAIDNPPPDADLLSSGQHCIELYVNGVNPAPKFDQPPANYTVRFFMAVPNAFIISGVNDNPYDNIVLTSQYPLTVGQSLSPPVASEKRIKATDPATRVSAAATLSWTPGITLGAYYETICFVLSQAGGPGIIPAKTTRCVLMVVERCKYVTQPGDDMRRVGDIFQSDWLSLWGLNVHLDTFDPAPGTEILIGRMYVVQKGDTLLSIAREFGTSIEGIKRLNYDIASVAGAERALADLKQICIFPDTCTE